MLRKEFLMKRITPKYLILRYLSLVAILAWTSPVMAQENMFNEEEELVQQEDGSEEDFLTQQQIEQILSDEGLNYDINAEYSAGNESSYTLGPNDVIKIDVSRHPEVSGEFSINKDGKIQYRFVGDLEISGLTKSQVKDFLVEELGKYIINPDVTVTITGFNSKIVYVIGEVGRPGKIFMRGDTITVREALVQAALPLLTAKSHKSLLITPSDDGQPVQKKINVHDLLYKGDLRENLVMKPGDTLYVPPTFLTKTLRTIQPVAAPIGTATGATRNVTGY